MVSLNLCLNRSVMVKTGCIWVSMWVRGNGQDVSSSGYGYEYMGLLNVGVDRGVSIRAGGI
jgi:hypothetical protein